MKFAIIVEDVFGKSFFQKLFLKKPMKMFFLDG